jgi:outer membrane immunogenic protein
MKNILIAAALALTTLAAPAMAQDATFTGPRVGATVGYDTTDGQDGVTYGGSAGYDFALKGVLVGVEATLEDSTLDYAGVNASRDLAVSARLGYVIAPRTLLFAKAGYATTRLEARNLHTNLEGVRFGGGAEYALSRNTYLSAEYRRTEYENDFGGRDQVIAGIGFRF